MLHVHVCTYVLSQTLMKLYTRVYEGIRTYTLSHTFLVREEIFKRDLRLYVRVPGIHRLKVRCGEIKCLSIARH